MSDEKEKLDLDDLAKDMEAVDTEIDFDLDDAPELSGDNLFGEDEVGSNERLGAIYDVPVQVSAVLGKASMPVGQLIKLGRGAILELDRKVGESVDIVVNNRLVARGEVVIVDERIGITMTEIIKSET